MAAGNVKGSYILHSVKIVMSFEGALRKLAAFVTSAILHEVFIQRHIVT